MRAFVRRTRVRPTGLQNAIPVLEAVARYCLGGTERLWRIAEIRIRALTASISPALLKPRLPSRHSLMTKVLIVGIVFSIVPVIIYNRLGEADREKSMLLLKAATDQGRLIATHLAPLFRKGPESLPDIEKALASLSTEGSNIRILFRPKATKSDVGFYYVAAYPSLSEPYLRSEINRLASLGILSRLSASCSHDRSVAMRHSMDGGAEQLITIVAPLDTKNGCWAIVTSHSSGAFLGSSLGRAYWQTPEIQFASFLYLSAAGFTLLVLLRIRRGMHVFRNTAVATGRPGSSESFAKMNRNPELADVAVEFDRMVQRIGLLSFAVERCPIAISIADRNWQLQYVNPAYERLSGRGSDELLGRDLRYKEFQSASDMSWAEICLKVAHGETWHGEIRRSKPDGRMLWADVSLYRLVTADGSGEHFVCMQEDVTEQKLILNDLIDAKDKAETLNRMKSNFVARMSHEFRTPLNAVLGFSEIIANQTFGKCDVPKYVEYADNIHSSGLHLLSLINDILDLSKLESGKENLLLEPIGLAALVLETTTLVETEAKKAQVALQIDDRLDGCRVIADRRAIKQVLLNLLSNSIKFTPAGGTVSIAAERRQDDKVLLTVADTGCGIDEADIPKICEPYERAGTAYVRNTSGTGLGLPIVKRLIELQNGEFRITSEVGTGTTAVVVLSAAPESSRQ